MILKCIACKIALDDENDDLYFIKCEFCPLSICNKCGLKNIYEYFADYDSYADLCKECYADLCKECYKPPSNKKKNTAKKRRKKDKKM
jgi:hypothetical protein